MGMDLILAGVQYPEGRVLDFEAGRRAVDTLTEDQLNAGLDAISGDADEDDPDAMRREVRDLVTDIETAFAGEWRDSTSFIVNGTVLFLGGGSSGGDDPGPTFTALANIGYFPSIMEAIGFEAPQ